MILLRQGDVEYEDDEEYDEAVEGEVEYVEEPAAEKRA